MVKNYYLDSSVALRILLGDSPTAANWLDNATSQRESIAVVSSRLLRTEVTRVLRRVGLNPLTHDLITRHIGLIPLTNTVLIQAEAIVPHIKPLDAIHLATALSSGLDDIIICTHDRNMSTVATALGLKTYDPVND